MKYNNEPYLRSEDLLSGGKYLSPTMKIEAVMTGCPLMQRSKKGDGLESRSGYGLKFHGKEKVLGLGKTNEGLIKVIAGDALPEKWVGMTIRLEVRLVQSPGVKGTEPAIRIMPPNGTIMRSGLMRQIGKAIDSHEPTADESPPKPESDDDRIVKATIAVIQNAIANEDQDGLRKIVAGIEAKHKAAIAKGLSPRELAAVKSVREKEVASE